MKKMVSLIALLLLALSGSASASAKEISIDQSHFPDPGFREYVKNTYDIDQDSYLSDSEVKEATEMNVFFNDDPELMITVRTCWEEGYLDLGGYLVIDEFSCDQISKHPLSDYKYRNYYDPAYYVVGCYPWKNVINQGVHSLRGIEYLTNLKSLTLGGSISKKLVISGVPHLEKICLGGTISSYESVRVKDCPKLTEFYFARTADLRRIDVSGANSLIEIGEKEYRDSRLEYGDSTDIKNPETLILGKAPKLKEICFPTFTWKHVKMSKKSLQKINSIYLTIDNPKQDFDFSSYKNLKRVAIYGRYHKLILPNHAIRPAYYVAWDDNEKMDGEIIDFSQYSGPRIVDLAKSQSPKDYANTLINTWYKALKKNKELFGAKTYSRKLIVNGKSYHKQRKAIQRLQKYGIKVQIRG